MESKATEAPKCQGSEGSRKTGDRVDDNWPGCGVHHLEHVDLGLTSSLANVSTQLPTHHLEKCPTGTNGELDEAGILIETQTQEMSTA